MALTSRLIAVAYTCIFICINSKCPESKKNHTHANQYILSDVPTESRIIIG
jgi:hypothetical protein